ncbi:MAG: diaminopimelate epimerase [Candidatus Syntrophosphaera sp.]|nr:diaminopimelate epimerase [Candidatus Syntrophosphaera sp.]
MLIPFRKMQAQGNDFIILLLTGQKESRLSLEALAMDICDRRKGAGADGLVLLLDDPEADARMTIFNSDGSRAEMCGSALRCCSRLVYEITGRTELSIATDDGIKTASIANDCVEVNMGKPDLFYADKRVAEVRGSLVGVGNLHFVSFWENLVDQEYKYGPVLERHPDFPGEVNSQFVRVIGRGEIELRIWERGCGTTQACGTGAVASVFCGIGKDLLDNEVKVNMPGGNVCVRYQDNGEFILAGSVEHVYSGVYRWKI